MKKRIGILTGGGDVPGLNAVIAAATERARALNMEITGFLRGWQGVLDDAGIDLSAQTVDPAIGGTILKTSRANIRKIKNGLEKTRKNLEKRRLSGLIVIGGEDTLSNALLFKTIPLVFIAKTIDNDVGRIMGTNAGFSAESILNYFTLGYPTAARKIASLISWQEGLRTTAYSHERILVVEAMGMHAGWLALASGMGNPDFIIIPEFPLDYGDFLEKVRMRYESRKHLIIVIAEGARWSDGTFIRAEKEEDSTIDHPRFGGAAEALKNRLKKDSAGFCNIRNINAVNPSYLYRSGAPSDIDRAWGLRLGKKAVDILDRPLKEAVFLTLQRGKKKFHLKAVSLAEFQSSAEWHRFVDGRFYRPEDFQITEYARTYLREFMRELPGEETYGLKD